MMTSHARNAIPSNAPNDQVPKVPTGIRGMDEVLKGGVPRGSLTLLSGGPGAGKTILGLEFLVRGAEAGSPGILLSFEEREMDLRRYGHVFGWDIAALEDQKRLALINAHIQPDAILSGDFDLRGILSILRQQVGAMGAERIVIDAPDVFLRLLDNAVKERTELYVLNDWLRDGGLTTLMTVKAGENKRFTLDYDFLQFMADCVIHLDQRVVDQLSTRRLRVIKYRGSGFGRNEYPFGITHEGVWIIPVTQTSLKHRALGESIPTGVRGLDDILAGGYRRGSCTLITGTSGTGKTTFACSFVRDVIAKDERVLYLNFEESWDSLASCMISSGIDLKPVYETGRLKFVSTMPESQGVEEHLIQAFRVIEAFEPDHLVLDAISACRRMGSSHAAFDYLLRLINHCKQRGITSLLTNLAASDAANEITGIDLSSVIDTVLILRNVETGDLYKRTIGVLKSRGRRHSSRIHEFHITDHGIDIMGKETPHEQ